MLDRLDARDVGADPRQEDCSGSRFYSSVFVAPVPPSTVEGVVKLAVPRQSRRS